MTALFDSGSSNIHFGLWNSEILYEIKKISYQDSWEKLKREIELLLKGIEPDKIAACSVSPKWKTTLFRILNDLFPGKLVVAEKASDLNIEVLYDKPESYGIDRALDCYYAFNLFKNSCVVVDAGTAVTIDAVDKNGRVLGGYIIPGWEIFSESLSEKTRLPHINFENNNDIGKSTLSCLKNGISSAFRYAVVNLVKKAVIVSECGNRIIVTGGDGEIIKKCFDYDVIYKPDMILYALAQVADMLPEYK